MPGGDRTGPYGTGPAGFGRGPCGRGFRRFSANWGRCIYRVPYRDPDLTKEERLKILKAKKEDIEKLLKELEGAEEDA